eukprot:11194611-Lingulodinium_polyedra.AAC.1
MRRFPAADVKRMGCVNERWRYSRGEEARLAPREHAFRFPGQADWTPERWDSDAFPEIPEE